MHTRLPSFTFVTDPTFAQKNWVASDPSSLTFFQGSDIVLEFYLEETPGIPLSLDKYSVTFFLKKSEQAENILFRGEVTASPPDKAPGVYAIKLPYSVSSRLRPGVYYYVVQASQKGVGNILLPFRGYFSLEVSCASPNPNLTHQDGEPTAIGQGGTADELLTPAENIGPHTPDIGRPF